MVQVGEGGRVMPGIAGMSDRTRSAAALYQVTSAPRCVACGAAVAVATAMGWWRWPWRRARPLRAVATGPETLLVVPVLGQAGKEAVLQLSELTGMTEKEYTK